MEKEKKEIWIEKLIELLNEYEIEKEKSEWKYRIIEVKDTYINQTVYIPQKKNWFWIWRDISYWKFFIEMAEDDIEYIIISIDVNKDGKLPYKEFISLLE